jgi:hypothetical protein
MMPMGLQGNARRAVARQLARPTQARQQMSRLLERAGEVLAQANPSTGRLDVAPLGGSCAQHLHWSLLASIMRWIAFSIIA